MFFCYNIYIYIHTVFFIFSPLSIDAGHANNSSDIYTVCIFVKFIILNIGESCFRLISIAGYKSLHKSVTYGEHVASLPDMSVANTGIEFIREFLSFEQAP